MHCRKKRSRDRRHRGRRRLVTGSAALAITAAMAHAGTGPDQHMLDVRSDVDLDYLGDREEQALAYRLFCADQNRNGVEDGIDLAQRCAQVIADLPFYEDPHSPPPTTYKIRHDLRGSEDCHVCGLTLNMGGIQIVNPRLHLEYPTETDPLDPVFLPYMAIHYMEHGSFNCSGTVHLGRVDVARLMRVLELRFPYEPDEHEVSLDEGLVPPPDVLVSKDLDGDLLADLEELAARTNLYDPDQNENLIPDGPELARRCVEIFEALPLEAEAAPGQTYKWLAYTYGTENCHICGETVNMGPAGIVNPRLGLEISFPQLALHTMSHGSFTYGGTEHGGRVDVPLLLKVLEMPQQCGDVGTVFHPADTNRDCHFDLTDLVETAQSWLASTDPADEEEGPVQ